MVRVGDMVIEEAFEIMKRTLFEGWIVHERRLSAKGVNLTVRQLNPRVVYN